MLELFVVSISVAIVAREKENPFDLFYLNKMLAILFFIYK